MSTRDPLANPEPLIRRVYAYVAYRIGDGPEAEDVTSAAFERALRYRSSFDARRGDALSWLIGIARRCIVDALEAREATFAEAPIEPAAGLIEDDAVRRLDVVAAVAELSPRDRELIALRFGADLTARQIGELLDMRTNAVEVALHRALHELRTRLSPEREARRLRATAEA
jgi:RNA polymerase sigma factor (sigma-70 family)